MYKFIDLPGPIDSMVLQTLEKSTSLILRKSGGILCFKTIISLNEKWKTKVSE